MQVEFLTQKEFEPVITRLENVEQRLNEISPLTSGDILTDSDLTKILKISRRTLINWRKEGKISFTQVGSLIFYSKQDVLNFMNRFKKVGHGQK